jgi:hypothetical protein
MHHLYFLNHEQPFIYSNKLHMCLDLIKDEKIKIIYFNTKKIKIEVWQLMIISAIIWYISP